MDKCVFYFSVFFLGLNWLPCDEGCVCGREDRAKGPACFGEMDSGTNKDGGFFFLFMLCL